MLREYILRMSIMRHVTLQKTKETHGKKSISVSVALSPEADE